jgi:phosphomevalonate kinase
MMNTNKGGQNISGTWFMDRDRQNSTIVSADVTDNPFKTIRTTFVLSIFRQFDSCFKLFNIAE